MKKVESFNFSSITDHILKAREKAFLKGIEANSILINKEIAYHNGIVVSDDFGRVKTKPMIFGLKINYTDTPLPFNANFAIFNNSEESEEEKKKIRAFDIIAYKSVNIALLKYSKNFEMYNNLAETIDLSASKLSEEQFNLLKEFF